MEKKNNQKARAWHRDLVLISKNTFIWLNQLSRKYQRSISSLDQIPEEEFDYLKSFGINGIWLIGIWKRSPASKKIKAMYGRKNLIASAYSIYEYCISEEIGGEDALNKFKQAANKHGLHVGCDMVPNHTGIDAPWVINHPDWFICSDDKLNEEWSYTSENLCGSPGIKIQLEDGYYNETKAAEIFKYQNEKLGKQTYIFHGNDGTSMPWNDTAQLNYLLEDVHSAMKEEIFKAAKKFDIIRLDAAMTLIKRHFKRLWFPDDDEKKHIPYRSSFTMSQEDFDRKMPHEFWAEVMNELPEHAPDTLMLAEAFWLMERYFVKELGMHRVYNSAFMNQLRDEDNSAFHHYLSEILDSEPILLEKFVNYLTTPDETTAVEQFGKSEKYFGVCGFMAAMPGLPMFGHGQLEGFSEKYGMDLKDPLMEETPDEDLMEGHKRLIAPLLKNRRRFSGSDNFRLLEFLLSNGEKDNNVFVISNRFQNEQSLIIFNNQDKHIQGTIALPASRSKIPYKLSENSGDPFSPGVFNQEDWTVFLSEMRSHQTMNLDRGKLNNQLPFELTSYELLVFDVESEKVR